jgi:hypothetical protein
MLVMIVLSMVVVTALPLLGSADDAANGAWAPPETLVSDASFDNGGALQGVSATTADGHVLAAWTIDPGQSYVQYALFDPATGWGPTLTYYDFFGTAGAPAVTALPNGSLYLALVDDGLFWPVVVGAMWTPDSGWHAWEAVSSDVSSTSLSAVRLAAAGNGDMFAVWLANDGTETNLTAARRTASGGWGTNQPAIESYPATPSANYLRLVADGSGNAIAAWIQSDGTSQHAFANRFVVGSGWGGSGTAIDNSGADTTSRVDVAVDGTGNAVAVFAQFSGTTYHVYTNAFTVGSGWATPEQISVDDDYHATDVRVAGSAGGVFAAAWLQGTPTYQDVHAATYTASGGWSAVQNLTSSLDAVTQVSVGVGGSGTVHVLFSGWTPGSPNVMHPRAAMWTSSAGWAASAQLSNDQTGGGELTCSSAEACSAWIYISTGGHQIVSVARYVGAPTLTVTAPEDASSTAEPTVVVTGHTDPGVTITVSGTVAEVSASGDFSVRVALAAGENTLVITARGDGGSSSSTTRTVTFDDPLVDLTEELEHTHEGLHTAQHDLSDARAELAATQANLTATQAALNAATAAQTAANAAQQETIDANAGSAGTAMMVGLLGLVVGLAAIAVAFMMGRKGGGPSPAAAAPPKPEGEPKP